MLGDYRPIALTSVVMKTLQRLVLQFLKSIIDPMLDRFQFAYRGNRYVDVLKYLEGPDTYARILLKLVYHEEDVLECSANCYVSHW